MYTATRHAQLTDSLENKLKNDVCCNNELNLYKQEHMIILYGDDDDNIN